MSEYRQTYKHLYDISIDELKLSIEAYNPLKRMGIESVGDIIDLYIRGTHTISLRTPPFGKIITGEVKERLVDADYWKYVENYRNDKLDSE